MLQTFMELWAQKVNKQKEMLQTFIELWAQKVNKQH
jgi:hypothetical protein